MQLHDSFDCQGKHPGFRIRRATAMCNINHIHLPDHCILCSVVEIFLGEDTLNLRIPF